MLLKDWLGAQFALGTILSKKKKKAPRIDYKVL